MTFRVTAVMGLVVLQALASCRGSRSAGAQRTSPPPPASKKSPGSAPAASVAPKVLSINEQLELVFATEHVPPPYTGPRVSSIVGGCAILVSGGSRCFEETIPGPQPQLSPAGVFFDGGHSGCFVAPDSTVRCWGAVPSHVLDSRKSCHWEPWQPHPEGEDRHCPKVGGFYYCGFDQICATPVKLPGLSQVVQLEGSDQVCALRRSGEVWCWGENSNLEGPGLNRCKVPPGVQDTYGYGHEPCFDPKRVLGIPPMTSIALSSGRTCALTGDSRLFCWGWLPPTYSHRTVRTLEGKEGSPPTEQTKWPKLKQALVMGDQLCGLTLDGNMLCQQDEEPSPRPIEGFEHMLEIRGDGMVCGRTAAGEVWCSNNQYRDGLRPPRKVPGITSAVQLFTNYVMGCAVQRDGSAYCWGNWHYQGKFDSWPPMPALQ